jgi:hypothetical protein
MVATGAEVFALTDEQILGMEPQAEVASDDRSASARDGERSVFAEDQRANSGGETQDPRNEPGSLHSGPQEARPSGRDDNNSKDSRAEAGVSVPQAPPQWLTERMRDPWHGDEAKELWESALQAKQEAAAYREAIATPAEARALKELYPGGVNEAKSAAERARQLDDFDAAYFGAVGKTPEALSAARVQLAQRLMEQDPAAFREMVAAGVRLLEGHGQSASGTEQRQDASSKPQSPISGPQNTQITAASVPPEVASRYAAFEKATNSDLEKSVGGAIARAMEQALPNLKSLDRAGQERAAQGAPLQERLGAAVREDVEVALKSDAQLGEQVAKILQARRFDDATRAQVVRVIDARAQQLVPGAVKRVVGSWTAATLAAPGKSRAAEGGSSESRASHDNAVQAAPRPAQNNQGSARKESAAPRTPARPATRGRVDYGKLTDEQILDL